MKLKKRKINRPKLGHLILTKTTSIGATCLTDEQYEIFGYLLETKNSARVFPSQIIEAKMIDDVIDQYMDSLKQRYPSSILNDSRFYVQIKQLR